MTTLTELQERYPHGSRWRWRSGWNGRDVGTSILEVVGWLDEIPVMVDHADGGRLMLMPDHSKAFERIPDPVPCPITEPVTLWAQAGREYMLLAFRNDGGPDTTGRVLLNLPGDTVLYLHPPRDGEPYGRWTWEGGPE